MPIPKKKKVHKSDARRLCEDFLKEFGIDRFEFMVKELKSVYYHQKSRGWSIPDAIVQAAHSYQATYDTHLTDGELKMILGHTLNVSKWWGRSSEPVPKVHEGERIGQTQLFLENLTFPEDPAYALHVLIHNRRIAKS